MKEKTQFCFSIPFLSSMEINTRDKILIVITRYFSYNRNYIYITTFPRCRGIVNVPTIQRVIFMYEMPIANYRCNNFMNLT